MLQFHFIILIWTKVVVIAYVNKRNRLITHLASLIAVYFTHFITSLEKISPFLRVPVDVSADSKWTALSPK